MLPLAMPGIPPVPAAGDAVIQSLSICRVVITYTLDLLRAGQGMGETPVVILGQHIMSHRDLGAFRWGIVLLTNQEALHEDVAALGFLEVAYGMHPRRGSQDLLTIARASKRA